MLAQLLAGTGRCDITPAPGTPPGGWGAQTHQRGTGADMPFFATALVLSHGDEQVAILDVDAIGFDREFSERTAFQAIELFAERTARTFGCAADIEHAVAGEASAQEGSCRTAEPMDERDRRFPLPHFGPLRSRRRDGEVGAAQ